MKTLGNVILVFLPISLVGLIFKMAFIRGGVPILAFSLIITITLLFIQYFLILRKFKNYPTLKAISSLMSLGLSIILIAILFGYQWWPGAMLLYLISALLFILFLILFIVNYKQMLKEYC